MFVTPQTFLVGYTQVCVPSVIDYLVATGQMQFKQDIDEAFGAGLSGAEILCSMFAKLCYKSLTVGGNANVSKTRSVKNNLVATYDSAHGSVFEHAGFNFIVTDCSRVFCYAPGTEVFTAVGWKDITELSLEDELMTLNNEGFARWSRPESVHSFDYNGKLLGWETSQMASPLMTPDHLLWAAPYDLRRARGLTNEENIAQYAAKIPFESLYGKRFSIQHGVNFEVDDPERLYIGHVAGTGADYDPVDLFAWLGWMSTDGSFSKDRPNQCTITQSKTQYIPEIRALMNRLFGEQWREHGPYDGNGVVIFTITNSELASYARDMIGPSKAERSFHQSIYDFHPRILRAMYDAALKGDGNVHDENGHEVLYCPSARAAGQWQVIIATIGKCANVRVDDRVGEEHECNGMTIRNTKPCYVISVSRKTASLVKIEHQIEKDYNGKVYCPKTEDGLIFVRRSGLAFWAGNTHELVRHRAGTAFSQTSGRYCRPTDKDGLPQIDFIHDPILDPVKPTIETVITLLAESYRYMEIQLGLLEPAVARQMLAKAREELNKLTHYGSWKIEDEKTDGLAKMIGQLEKYEPSKMDFDYKKKLTSALRRILPNGQANEIAFSCNIRTLRHIVQLRTQRFAEWEIRCVFAQVYSLVKARFPMIFYGARTQMVDGLPEVYGMRLQPYDVTVAGLPTVDLMMELRKRGFKDAREKQEFIAALNSPLEELDAAR